MVINNKNMGLESVKYADNIILETFEKGLTIPDLKDNPVVESRLKMFGYWEGRTYYLNDRGMEYAMRGCSKGILRHIENMKRIDNLTIKIQSFLESKQKITFRMSVFSVIASILGILIGCLGLFL